MPLPLPAADTVSSNVVEVEYIHTADEAVRSSLAMSRALAPQFRWLPWLGAVLLGIAAWLIFSRASGWQVAWLLGAFGLFFLLQPLLARWSLRRGFAQQPGAQAKIRWHITADALTSEGPFGHTHLPWGALIRIEETRHGYLLFTHARLAQWLPRSAFKSTQDAALFARWVAANRDVRGTHPHVKQEPATSPYSIDAASIAAEATPGQLASAGFSELRVSFRYTAEEAIRARRAWLRATPVWLRVAPWLAAPLLLAGVFFVVLAQYWDWRQLAVLVGLLAGFGWLVRRRRQKDRAKAFAQSPDAEREVRWRIDPQSLAVAGAHTDASFRWTDLLKVRETRDGFLIFQQPRLAQWLPTDAFTSAADLQQFRTWIYEHSVDFKRLP